MTNESLPLVPGLVLQLSSTAATGLAVLFTRDVILANPTTRAELKAFNIRCTVGLANLLRLSSRLRLSAVQVGLTLYHVQRIAVFHGLNSLVAVRVLLALIRVVLGIVRS